MTVAIRPQPAAGRDRVGLDGILKLTGDFGGGHGDRLGAEVAARCGAKPALTQVCGIDPPVE
jgi:hypothetical protein